MTPHLYIKIKNKKNIKTKEEEEEEKEEEEEEEYISTHCISCNLVYINCNSLSSKEVFFFSFFF